VPASSWTEAAESASASDHPPTTIPNRSSNSDGSENEPPLAEFSLLVDGDGVEAELASVTMETEPTLYFAETPPQDQTAERVPSRSHGFAHDVRELDQGRQSQYEAAAVSLAVMLWQTCQQFPDASISPFEGAPGAVTVPVDVPALIARLRAEHLGVTSSVMDGNNPAGVAGVVGQVDGTNSWSLVTAGASDDDENPLEE